MTKLLRFFIFPVNISAGFADQDLLTFGAGDLHVGLVGAEVGFTAAGAEGPAAGFTNQRLLAKAALDHLRQAIRESVDWKGLTCAGYAESLLSWFGYAVYGVVRRILRNVRSSALDPRGERRYRPAAFLSLALSDEVSRGLMFRVGARVGFGPNGGLETEAPRLFQLGPCRGAWAEPMGRSGNTDAGRGWAEGKEAKGGKGNDKSMAGRRSGSGIGERWGRGSVAAAGPGGA